MANSVKYYPGDKVVVRTKYYKSDESKLQVALVTNVNPAGKLNKRTYDVRTEAGSGMIQVSVDDKKDGEEMKADDTILGHYEKHNNFIFPTQGPRSF